MFKRALFLSLIVLTAACAPKLKMQPGYQLGQYSIKELVVEPASPELAADPEYIEAERRIQQGYPWEHLGEGKMPEARLTLQVFDVSFEVNAARALLVGDPYRIQATLKLTDLNTGGLLAEEYVVSTVSEKRDGLVGVVLGNMDSPDVQKEQIARDFISAVIAMLYPEKK